MFFRLDLHRYYVILALMDTFENLRKLHPNYSIELTPEGDDFNIGVWFEGNLKWEVVTGDATPVEMNNVAMSLIVNFKEKF